MNYSFKTLYSFWVHSFPGLSQDIFEQVLSHYQEKHRFYHNENHIFNLLYDLEKIGELNRLSLSQIQTLEWAIWFHDIVYSTNIIFFKNNESNSALQLNQFARNNYLDKKRAKEAILLINNNHSNNILQHIFSDIDYSVFSKDWPIYNTYRLNIRKEFNHIPEFIFNKNRIKFLQSVKGKVFKSELYKEKNIFADKNILKELEILKQ